ncbi:MAG: helix-turn-helix domain-containing protein [Gammaproteobacteria bacterium]|jgi:AraC-like DNA-binding protein
MSKFYRPFQPTLTQAGLHQLGLSMKAKGPCDALTGIVHSYLQIKAERQTLYPVILDGSQAIYIPSHGSMISGALTEATEVQLLQPGEYFGIWFYPGALRHLFELNLSEISGQFVDEKYFQCHSFLELHTDIYKYKHFSDRADICERWVLEQYSIKPATCFDHALSIIYQSLGSERVGNIASKVGWSSRHLNRQFLEHTGLSTKGFSQIVRAQNFCKQLYLRSMDSVKVSLDLGYYDQSHLIKEFKKHVKSTPGEFIKQYMSEFYNR